MTDRSLEVGEAPGTTEMKSVDPVDPPAVVNAEPVENGRHVGQDPIAHPARDEARPDPLKLFHARWERNKPGFEFLAGS